MLKLMGQAPQDDYIDVVPTTISKSPRKASSALLWVVAVNLSIACILFWTIVISSMIDVISK